MGLLKLIIEGTRIMTWHFTYMAAVRNRTARKISNSKDKTYSLKTLIRVMIGNCSPR